MTDRMPYVYFPQCTVMTSIMAIFYYMLQVVLVCDLDIPSHHTPPRLCPLMGTSMPAAFSAADRVQLLTAWKLSISSTLYFFPAPSVCDPGLLVLFNPRKLRCFGVPAPLLFIAFRNASVWYRSPPGVGVVATLGEEGRSVTPGDWNEALCFNLHHPFHAHHVCAVLRPCLVPGHEITIEGIAFRRARPAEGHSGSVSQHGLFWTTFRTFLSCGRLLISKRVSYLKTETSAFRPSPVMLGNFPSIAFLKLFCTTISQILRLTTIQQ